MKLLDCTFRDGGYYNDWDFSSEIVAEYLSAMSLSGIDAVEIGFRSPPASKFTGALLYSRDEYLRNLKIPDNLYIGVMINGKEYTANQILTYFCDATESAIKFVRIATHFDSIELCRDICYTLRKLNYFVCLNLMQISTKTPEEIKAAASTVESWQCVDVLYVADSLGNLGRDDILSIFNSLQPFSGEKGLHAHNNKGQALDNSLYAAQIGFDWIDGTVMGIGRGAGNAQTEYLMIESEQYNTEPLFSLIMNKFMPLHEKYRWGPNLFYYLAAKKSVHPTYVQTMSSKYYYDPHQMLACIMNLGHVPSTSYSETIMECAAGGYGLAMHGRDSVENIFADRDVLIMAAGPSCFERAQDLQQLAKEKNFITIGLNSSITDVAMHAVCHLPRLISEFRNYHSNSRIITPWSAVPDYIKPRLEKFHIIDFGLTVREDTFRAEKTGCVIPRLLVAPYVFALCLAANARRIYLAGFDGYPNNQQRHKQMQRVFDICLAGADRFFAITPTSYDIPCQSMYLL